MFGFIKKIFGGIFSFLGGLFGSKKSEYFLELEDSKSESAAKAQAGKPEPAKVEKTAPAPAAAKAEPAIATKTTTEKKTAEKAPAAAAYSGKAIAKEDLQQKAPQAVGGFATSYLVPTPNTPRRRPGANMGSFLDMARNVQTSTR